MRLVAVEEKVAETVDEMVVVIVGMTAAIDLPHVEVPVLLRLVAVITLLARMIDATAATTETETVISTTGDAHEALLIENVIERRMSIVVMTTVNPVPMEMTEKV
jgi:hypothetical protein